LAMEARVFSSIFIVYLRRPGRSHVHVFALHGESGA